MLKDNDWTRKKIARLSLNRSEELRQRYLRDIERFTAEDLIFLDESIVNEKTG